VTSVPARSLTLTVSPPLGVNAYPLDPVQGGNETELAVDHQRPPLGREGGERLVGPGPKEHLGVQAALAIDQVVPVPRDPLEDVVARPQGGQVEPLPAGHQVVAVAAEQGVVAVPAEHGVVPGPAGHAQLDHRGQVAAGGEEVVAAVRVQHQLLGRADVQEERGRRRPVEPDAVVRGGRHRERLGRARAVDRDRVRPVLAVVRVGPVARVPDHPVVIRAAFGGVVAGPAGQGVVPRPARQEVVARLAEQGVVPGVPEQEVVPGPADQGVTAAAAEQVGHRQAPGDRDPVVPALPIDGDDLDVGHGRGAARDRHRPAVDEDAPVRRPADGDRVASGVAQDLQVADGRSEQGRNRRDDAGRQFVEPEGERPRAAGAGDAEPGTEPTH
jgi:hypothetical protein